MTFQEWYKAVDKEFIRVTGLDRDSFPDACYRDMHEDGFNPIAAVAQALVDGFGYNLVAESYPELAEEI